jgi:hypothetical protein
LICCDCGLAHDFEFQVVQVRKTKNGALRMTRVAPRSFTVQFRARRNERSTALVRRAKHRQPEKESAMAAVKSVRAKPEKKVATATIHGIGRMTKRGRRDIAAWLRNLADGIEKQGEQYTDGRFRAGFRYV